MINKVKEVRAEKVATYALFIFLILCLVSVIFTLVRCQPESIVKDIEIDCKWKGESVSANLKWTEPKEDPASTTTTNKDAGSKTSQVKNTTTDTQRTLMLTGAASGAALAGGGILVKKKLEGGNSSEQDMKQTTSTSTTSSTSSTSSTIPKYTSDNARSSREMLEPHQDELKSSSQSQSSTQNPSSSQTQQSKQSNTQNPPKDNGPPTTAEQQYMQKQMNSQSSQPSQPPTQTQRLGQSGVQTSTSSTVAASVTITKELLMQKQMDSQTKQSMNSTSAQAGGTQQPKQETASSTSTSTSTTSQSIGLLASSSSAARIATEMWPQRQKELEQLAKQRADLAAKFSIPSYSTGLSLTSSFTSATGNAWAKLQGFGSAIGDGLSKAGTDIKPYMTYIMPVVVAAIVLISIFFLPPVAPVVAGAGMAGVGISVSQGAGLVGVGIAGGIGIYALHNTIMNYPQHPNFETKQTQILQQPQTSEIRDEKGSGPYGEDVAQEQLEQADITKDSLIQGDLHDNLMKDAEDWLKGKGQEVQCKDQAELDPETLEVLSRYGQPDIITEDYIVECKKGTYDESQYYRALDQAEKYVKLIEHLAKKGVKKTLVYWFAKLPTDPGWETVLNYLLSHGVKLMPDEIFGGG